MLTVKELLERIDMLEKRVGALEGQEEPVLQVGEKVEIISRKAKGVIDGVRHDSDGFAYYDVRITERLLKYGADIIGDITASDLRRIE